MVMAKNAKVKWSECQELLDRIATPLSLYLVPTNLEEEEQKFLESSTYNPQFTYRKPQRDNEEVLSALEKIEEIVDVDPAISKFVLRVIQSKRQADSLFRAVGDDIRFPVISGERFKIPSYISFKKACRILRGVYGDIKLVDKNEELSENQLDYDRVAEIFQKVFEILGLEDWSVGKSKAILTAGIRTLAKTRRVMIDPKILVDAEKIRKTIIHEILTHALRAHNGFATGYEVFGKPNLAEYLDVEEGLAMYNEEKYGALKDIDVKKRAAYVYVIYLAQTMSFRQVFDALRAVYPPNNAFETVLRVKRGMSDTSKPGAHCKDASYLRGYLRLRLLLPKDKTSYVKLYAGKLPWESLELVEEGVLPKPKIVPDSELVARIFKETGLV